MLAFGMANASQAISNAAGDRPGKSSMQVHQWERWEHAFQSTASYGNPYRDVTLRVHLTGPGNDESSISGFYDGGATFRVRYAFPHPGEWSFVTECSNPDDAGLHGQTGTIVVTEYTGDNPLFKHGFPHAGGAGDSPARYLRYWDGEPFLYLADTTWFPWGNFNDATWAEYLDDRVERGFTVVQTSLGFNNWWSFWGNGGCDGSATDGIRPWFGTQGTADEYNPEFYQVVDAFVQAANERGIVVGVFGVMNAGSNSHITNTDRRRFARTIAARLQGNATTLSPPVDDHWSLNASVDNVGEHLRVMDDAFYPQLHTAHLETNAYNCDDVGSPGTYDCDFHDADWLDISGYQSGHNAPQGSQMILWAVRRAREMPLEYSSRTPIKPVINLEPLYSMPPDWFPPNADLDDNAYRCRQIAWYTFTSGGCGHAFGIWGIWDFGRYQQGYCGTPRVNWRDAMSNQYSREAQHLAAFLDLYPWYELRPRNDLLTNQTSDQRKKMTLAQTDLGDIMVAYVPRANSEIRIDTRQMLEDGIYRWYNPRNGQFEYEGPFENNDGSRSFASPNTQEDWVLVLQIDSYPTTGHGELSVTAPAVAGGIRLGPASPNPYTSGTAIDLDLAAGGHTRLAVYDVAGRLVQTILDRQLAGPGHYRFRWDGSDRHGQAVGAGIYFITVAANGQERTQKVIRLR
jgi:hypothetical protein